MIFGDSRSRRARGDARAKRRAAAAPSYDELPPKLIPSLRELISTVGALLHTRLALAGVELEEEIRRLIGAAVVGLVALLMVLMALVVGTFTIVAAVAPDARVATMIVITLVYLAVAIGLGLKLKAIFTDRPPIFGATLAELEKDKQTLSVMARAHRAGDEARERAEQRQEDAYSAARAPTGDA